MSVVRTQRSFVAIRTLSPSSSISRCPHASASSGTRTHARTHILCDWVAFNIFLLLICFCLYLDLFCFRKNQSIGAPVIDAWFPSWITSYLDPFFACFICYFHSLLLFYFIFNLVNCSYPRYWILKYWILKSYLNFSNIGFSEDLLVSESDKFLRYTRRFGYSFGAVLHGGQD